MARKRGFDAGLAARLGEQSLPEAFLDLAALTANARWLLSQADDKTIRVVTKSIRCVEALRYIQGLDRRFSGLMCYHPTEACWLSTQGFRDLLVAYPCVDAAVIGQVCDSLSAGADITLMVDDLAQLELIEEQAALREVTVPVCLDLDMSTAMGPIWFGVRRSPLRDAESLEPLVERIEQSDHLVLLGLMGYEAQIAGVPDRVTGKTLQNLLVPYLKASAWPVLSARRARAVARLRQAGQRLRLVNGGGTGSVRRTAADPVVTEIAVGSGFFAPHLFDGYRDLDLQPAAGFASRVVRRPGRNWATVSGGGYIASGSPGWDKQPRPAWPPGLGLDDNEAAGEAQTPLQGPGTRALSIGDTILFRHAKAGELCERFNRLRVLDGERDRGYWKTYRGEGQCFL